MARDIFISYSRKDLEAVKAIKDEIEHSLGVECWMDLDDIPADDDDYLDRIVEGIEQCNVFIFMLSKNSQESEHAIGELTAAKKQKRRTGIHVVVLNIDDCEMNQKFTIKYSRLNIIVWSDEPQRGNLIKNLQQWMGVLSSKSSNGADSPMDNLKNAPADIEEQYQLGRDYFYGYNGKAVNKTEAVWWYRKAAEEGHAKAQCNLGYSYELGHGVQADTAEAARWYRMAAEQGLDIAQNNMGRCYYYGKGINRDYTKAARWYRKAANQGYAEAQNNLGDCYFCGNGVSKNFNKAVMWYRNAVEQGLAEAQYNLGYCYKKGYGVPQNCIEAARWFVKAADQGLDEAIKELKRLL